jgi:2-haloacid dehalogenase
VRAGRIPFSKLDVLHRRNLERILPRFGLADLPETTRVRLNLAWHRLDAWPDVPRGLHLLKRRCLLVPVSNGNISLMVDLARRNNLPWDAILGSRDRRRLQAQASRLSRRRGSVRSCPLRLHDGRGAHQRSSPRRGMWPAHRPRGASQRGGPGRGEAAPGQPMDFAVASLPELADLLDG